MAVSRFLLIQVYFNMSIKLNYILEIWKTNLTIGHIHLLGIYGRGCTLHEKKEPLHPSETKHALCYTILTHQCLSMKTEGYSRR